MDHGLIIKREKYIKNNKYFLIFFFFIYFKIIYM